MNVIAVLDRLLEAAEDDWVGIWELSRFASSVGGAAKPEEVIALSLEVVRIALSGGLVEVGDVTNMGFKAWGVTTHEACRRIEQEWRRLPDQPGLGDMSCWFNITAKGLRRRHGPSSEESPRPGGRL